VTSSLDFYRSANVVVQEHSPEDALLFAAKRADVLLELGDIEGQRVWNGVLRAVEKLVRWSGRWGRGELMGNG
jgi:hypothetical protein